MGLTHLSGYFGILVLYKLIVYSGFFRPIGMLGFDLLGGLCSNRCPRLVSCQSMVWVSDWADNYSLSMMLFSFSYWSCNNFKINKKIYLSKKKKTHYFDQLIKMESIISQIIFVVTFDLVRFCILHHKKSFVTLSQTHLFSKVATWLENHSRIEAEFSLSYCSRKIGEKVFDGVYKLRGK